MSCSVREGRRVDAEFDPKKAPGRRMSLAMAYLIDIIV